MTDNLIRAQDFARMVGVSYATICRAVREGRLRGEYVMDERARRQKLFIPAGEVASYTLRYTANEQRRRMNLKRS